MRLVVISQATDLQALRKTLFTASQPAATTAAALERVKALNPHVDLQRLAPGTVLVLPDLPSMNPSHSRSLGGDAFAGLATEATNGLKAAVQRARAGADGSAADRSDVTAALRLAAVKRIVESDPTFSRQLEAAGARASADQKQAQVAAAAVEKLAAQTAAELAKLAKLFG